MSAPPLQVVFCDNHLLVVAKPACLPTVPDATGDESLLEQAKDWVRREYRKRGEVFLGVVQRLDRPVSGVLCFARTSKAAARLTAALRDRRINKAYLGVAARRPRGAARGDLEQWLSKDRKRNRVRAVEPGIEGARLAQTAWSVLGQGQPGVLLGLKPLTGRPHQLRVASASLGAPLLGDLKYGADAALSDRSIALHAHRLELDHPTRGERLCFEVPPPKRPWYAF